MGKQVLYRVGQAAKDLGVSSYKIRRLCETGLIDAEFSGSQWAIPSAEVERLKRNGVPSAPKIVDDDTEASSAPNAKAATALLAAPSSELVIAAEAAEISSRQLATAKNKLEQNKVRREQAEIEDFFSDRDRRLQEQEAAEIRRYEEELEADASRRDKEVAAEQRRNFFSKWIEYGVGKKPWGAPDEVRLDIHAEVLSTLAKLDASERDYVVERLVDAAVERGLRTWRSGETKRAAIENAISQLPWHMSHDETWKAQAIKIGKEALKDATGSKQEMTALARTALQPLTEEFEHAGRIEQTVNGVRVDGATLEELADARESVREALEALPTNSTGRQITAARDQALLPVTERVAERIAREQAQRQREEAKRQRELVLLSVSYRLPREISDDDEKAAIAEITEALNDLPPDASQRAMEKARDEIVEDYEEAYKEKARRAKKTVEQGRSKANLVQYGLTQIRPCAERLLRQFDYDRGDTVWDIDRRVRTEVQKTLEDELSGTETEPEVARIVREVMQEVEGCD